MALNIRVNNIIEGESVIDGVVVATYHASLNESNPQNPSINSFISNYSLYKANREEMRDDRSEFEDAVFAMQDEIMASNESPEEDAPATGDEVEGE